MWFYIFRYFEFQTSVLRLAVYSESQCYQWTYRLNFIVFEHHFVLFPIAFHYPELNTSHLLRSSWVRTGIMVSVACSWHIEMLLQSLTANMKQFKLGVLFLFCVFVVLLGVLDQKVGERTFQANMERRVAIILGEAMGVVRRVKRATTIGNSSVQVLFLLTDSILNSKKCL